MQRLAIQYHTMQRRPCYVMSCNGISCHARSCQAMSCNAMPFNAMQHHGIPCNLSVSSTHSDTAIQCHVLQCRKTPCSTMPCHIMLCNALPVNDMQHNATSCHAIQHHTIPCNATSCNHQCNARSCNALQHHAMSCHAIPYNTMQCHHPTDLPLSVAHQRKLDKSWEACHRQGIVFLPLAVESLGAWHPSAIIEIKRLGSALARHTGEEEATTTSRLFQRLSISLMRGNAALFNNRCPPEQSTHGDSVDWWKTVPVMLWLLCCSLYACAV